MKTAVYSWRLSAERKAELEAPEVRCLVVLPPIGSPNAATGHSDDDAEPPAIRRRAMAAIGSVAGGDPACSERAANWFAKSFAESMSSAMRSLAASAVGLIDAGAILALIGRGDECTLLASRPTPTVDCRVLRPKLCSQKFSTAMSAIFTMPAAFGSSCVPARFRFADRTCGLTADSGPDGSVCQPPCGFRRCHAGSRSRPRTPQLNPQPRSRRLRNLPAPGPQRVRNPPAPDENLASTATMMA
jgi:hypothetical protein